MHLPSLNSGFCSTFKPSFLSLLLPRPVNLNLLSFPNVLCSYAMYALVFYLHGLFPHSCTLFWCLSPLGLLWQSTIDWIVYKKQELISYKSRCWGSGCHHGQVLVGLFWVADYLLLVSSCGRDQRVEESLW